MSLKIDFHILTSDKLDDFFLTVCKIIEHHYLSGVKIFVLCKDNDEAVMFDKLLWSYKKESFIPHSLNLDNLVSDKIIPVQIGTTTNYIDDILINLSTKIPDSYQQFSKIIHIVFENDDMKKISREHYRFYRNKGYKLNTIKHN